MSVYEYDSLSGLECLDTDLACPFWNKKATIQICSTTRFIKKYNCQNSQQITDFTEQLLVAVTLLGTGDIKL